MGKLTCAITGYRPSRFRFKYNEKIRIANESNGAWKNNFLFYIKKESTISLSEAPWALICGLGKYCWR